MYICQLKYQERVGDNQEVSLQRLGGSLTPMSFYHLTEEVGTTPPEISFHYGNLGQLLPGRHVIMIVDQYIYDETDAGEDENISNLIDLDYGNLNQYMQADFEDIDSSEWEKVTLNKELMNINKKGVPSYKANILADIMATIPGVTVVN